MIKVTVRDHRLIHPFNDYARDLRVQNKPLWLHQRDLLTPYLQSEVEVDSLNEIATNAMLQGQACLVLRDNLYFDAPYIEHFIKEARKRGKPVRAAFAPTDASFREHALPLATSYAPAGGLYLADLWYYPNGPVPEVDVEPLIVDLQAREIGYYHVPTYMATQSGDLTFQVPLRALIAIDSWVHIFIADVVFGLFKRGAQFEQRLENELFFKLGILSQAMMEGRQVLECSKLVQIGNNCNIDPTAVIHGPTTIGDNVTIGPGAVIENCIIGDNVNVGQGCQLMLSVVGDGAFLPFRASLFMTTIMDNAMVAQNTCLQMCVIGRNTFIGAGSTFTDYNLLPNAIRAISGDGTLRDSNREVLGGCVGHNCRIGSGMIIYPARVIESDVVLAASSERRVIDRNIAYEDSDHHKLRVAHLHQRLYNPERASSGQGETW
jgi:carbonic anhydrase/acetyltransferase-like protein (isoleucine patch superfamily)